MLQSNRAPAVPVLPREQRSQIPGASLGNARLSLVGAPRGTALAGLFTDFTLEGAGANGGTPVVLWVGTAGAGRLRRRAAALGVPFVLLGEGLLRTPRRRTVVSATALTVAGPGSAADMLDPVRVLDTRAWETEKLLRRAATARRELVASRVGGAWWEGGVSLPRGDGLVFVDMRDTGGADRGRLRPMLTAALAENSAGKVIVLAPRDPRSHAGLGEVLGDAAAAGCVIVAEPVDPWSAIERAHRVYVCGGEFGFLALLAGCTVRCFDAAFYAGWGVTADDPAVPRRAFERSIDAIFAGACLVATRCRDPYRKTQAAFEEVVGILVDWRRAEMTNRRIAVCVGMSFWKRRRIAELLRCSAGAPVFRRRAASAVATARERAGAIAVWASRMPPALPKAAARNRVPLIRVEDGFVRSVGLGSDFMPAASLVLDGRGAYFDPSVKSDLEVLLLESDFDARLVERARRLIGQLVARGITKYNLAPGAATIAMPAGIRRILVPGQVEDDLSVLLGGGDIRSNLDLLARVRAANPAAFILYKPHPDVEAGHRKGAVPDPEARRFADAILRGVSTAALLSEIDELHTLTSLAGFEALLRRRRVVVYGRPFYAGWGLTRDVGCPERGRRLSLEELVAGVLILYPRYLDPVTRLPCGPEVVIERLADPDLWRPGPLVLARRLQGALARLSSAAIPAAKACVRRFG